MSGFKGANRTFGALSSLLAAIKDKKIPKGSYLLIENFDRLTREQLSEAVALLTDIIRAGLIVVTLSDLEEWTAKRLSDPASFIMLVLLLSRGHAESERKSEMITKVIARARRERKISIFGQRPGWLRIENGEFSPIPEKVESIQKVFAMATAGFGSYAICKHANAEGWPVPTGDSKWGNWLPNKLLSNRALLGEMEFRTESGGKRVVLDVCADWYPRVISDEVFYAARAAVDARKNTPARTDDHCRNLLKGIGVCGVCGASLLRRNHAGVGRRHGYGRYVCSKQFIGMSSCPTFNALDYEIGLIPKLYELYSENFSRETQAETARNAIDALSAQLVDIDKRHGFVMSAIEAGGDIPALVARLKLIEEERSITRDAVALAKAKYSAATVPDPASDIQDILRAICAPSEDLAARESRAQAHLKLLGFVEFVWLRRGAAMVKLRGEDTVLGVPVFSKADGIQCSFVSMFEHEALPQPQLSNRGLGRVALTTQSSPPHPD